MSTAAMPVQARGRAVARRAAEIVPLVLAFIAEGAWLSVLAGLANEILRVEPALGVPAMTLFVVAGGLAGWLALPRLGARWPGLAALLMLLAALVGVAAAPTVLAGVTSEGLGALEPALLGRNPGGLLAGLAFLRGAAYATSGLSEDRLQQLLGGGTVAIVVAALVGGLVPEALRGRFLGDALVAGVVFAAAGIVALALRRQSLEGRDRGADWQRNPRWVALLVAVVTLIAALAALSADLVRPALELLIAAAVLPLIVLGLIFGWTRRGVRLAVILAVVAGVVAIIFNVFGGAVRPLDVPPGAPDLPPGAPAPQLEPSVVALGGGLVILLAVVAAYLLVRWWMRRLGRDPADALEERYIDRPPAPQRGPRRRGWLARRATPRDAEAAYRALLRDLDDREGIRREAWETPREHAARLRRSASSGLPLELLAADYALIAYGDVPLSAREQRRAVARWRSLRRSIKPAPPPPDLAG